MKLNIEKNKHPIKKRAKDLNRHFSKEDIQMANKHMKRCLTLLIIRKMHIKSTMRYDLALVRMATIKKSTNSKGWRGCEGKGTLWYYSVQFSSVAQSCPTLWDPMQYTRPPCPSPTPGVYPNSRPLSRWCHPTISSSVIPFSYPQSFPASFPCFLFFLNFILFNFTILYWFCHI